MDWNSSSCLSTIQASVCCSSYFGKFHATKSWIGVIPIWHQGHRSLFCSIHVSFDTFFKRSNDPNCVLYTFKSCTTIFWAKTTGNGKNSPPKKTLLAKFAAAVQRRNLLRKFAERKVYSTPACDFNITLKSLTLVSATNGREMRNWWFRTSYKFFTQRVAC